MPVDVSEAWYSTGQLGHLYDQGEIKGLVGRWSPGIYPQGNVIIKVQAGHLHVDSCYLRVGR